MENQPVHQSTQPPQPPPPVQPVSPAQSPQPQACSCNYPAIIGFVLSFSINILGLIFSIIGLQQAKRTGGEARGYALAGLIISILSIVIGIWVLIVFVIATDKLADEFNNLDPFDSSSSIIESYSNASSGGAY